MNDVDVLVLHGSPGSGKSTLRRAISERLRATESAHAVIDLDELSLVHPSPRRSFACENLAAMWPNYAAIPGLKVVLDTVVADEDELGLLRAAVPAASFVVCELTAPVAVLKERVTAREPNEYWRSLLRDFVDLHHGRTDRARIRDFLVSTHDTTVEDSATTVLERAGWVPVSRAVPQRPAPRAPSAGPRRRRAR